MASTRGITVAVTGPSGDIGRALMRALERSREVGSIRAMGRRPLDPVEQGWRKTIYTQGDVTDRDAVDRLVIGADAVVHLAFAILGAGGSDGHTTNLEGSRNVFRAAVGAGVERLVYTSSVAAYGFHADNPPLLTEDVPPRGADLHAYSAEKAQVERLLREITIGSDTALYVFRPCIVAGPDALMVIENIPYVQIAERLPGPARRLLDAVPALKPVIPDNGVPFQLVHHDDVATALRAAVLGRGRPGIYNLAGPGTLTMRDLANDLGWYALPIPQVAVDALGEIAGRATFLPSAVQWVNALRVPVLMDTAKARRELRWRPRYGARETLRGMLASAREAGLVG